MEHRLLRGGGLALAGALLRAALAVQHIGTCHFMVAAAHQAQLHLVLNILDVEGAAARAAAQERAHHTLGQCVDRLAHAGRCRTLGAVHREEGFHQRHGDLVRLERHHRAIAPDDLVAGIGRTACNRLLRQAGRNHSGGGGGDSGLHGGPFVWRAAMQPPRGRFKERRPGAQQPRRPAGRLGVRGMVA